jgi:imidazolonepropionase-like amidohydrolase
MNSVMRSAAKDLHVVILSAAKDLHLVILSAAKDLHVLFVALTLAATALGAQPITIRAGTLLDGKGGVQRNVTVHVNGTRIERITPYDGRPVTYELSRRTVMPGMIDTHVHITSHFGKNGRASNDAETPADQLLYGAENAYTTLMAGFTTVQSIGAPLDIPLRDALNRGVLPGPRLLTSIAWLTDTSYTPEQIRDWVRTRIAEGADLIKIFASRSIREGGGQTLSDAKIRIACDEAKAAGKRSWVHAHASSAVRAATIAGCWAVTHGSQVTDADLALMAEKGTYFEPNIGLVSQNYLENKPRYLGIGNYTEEGFVFMEKGIPVKLDMFKRALRTPGLKLLMGTDATAGAHGQNAREIVYRVKFGGQSPRDAIVGITSLGAVALGMQDRVGSVEVGKEADLIALDGDPLTDITALQRVTFVMKAGKVHKNTH